MLTRRMFLFQRSSRKHSYNLAKRFFSNESLKASSNLEEVPVSPKIEKMVSDICELSLFETAAIVRILRQRLNIPEQNMYSSGPILQNSGATKVEEKIEKVVEKTEFNVSLEKFEPTSKAKIIREVKAIMPHLSLVDAKTFVEALPKVLKEKIKLEEANKLKATFEAIGATIEIS